MILMMNIISSKQTYKQVHVVPFFDMQWEKKKQNTDHMTKIKWMYNCLYKKSHY